MSEKKSGTIIHLKPYFGYGFIKPDDSEENLYFSEYAVTNLSIDGMRIGDRVEYGIVPQHPDKIQASHVTKIFDIKEN
jgi:cold shock CspA family protein